VSACLTSETCDEISITFGVGRIYDIRNFDVTRRLQQHHTMSRDHLSGFSPHTAAIFFVLWTVRNCDDYFPNFFVNVTLPL
jgi:hypothetical protein